MSILKKYFLNILLKFFGEKAIVSKILNKYETSYFYKLEEDKEEFIFSDNINDEETFAVFLLYNFNEETYSIILNHLKDGKTNLKLDHKKTLSYIEEIKSLLIQDIYNKLQEINNQKENLEKDNSEPIINPLNIYGKK